MALSLRQDDAAPPGDVRRAQAADLVVNQLEQKLQERCPEVRRSFVDPDNAD